MLVSEIALVAEKSQVDLPALNAVAGALQKQVTRDFAPLWHVRANVSAFAKLEDVPLDYWPIVIMDDIDDDSAGYHQTKNGQPFALVQYTPGNQDDWTLTASHEALEMLADPFGRRLVAGQSPKRGQGRVKFLVEVCDPCEDKNCSYTVNGIVVSDFYTPHFFDPETDKTVRYSYRGFIKAPRQVLKGGYLTWHDVTTDTWWQRTWFDGDKAIDTEIDLEITDGNLRGAVDRLTETKRRKAIRAPAPKSLLATARPLPGAEVERGAKRGANSAFATRAEHIRYAIERAGKK